MSVILEIMSKILRYQYDMVRKEYNRNIPKVFGGEKNHMIKVLNTTSIFMVCVQNLSNYINYMNPPESFEENLVKVVENQTLIIIRNNFIGLGVTLVLINVVLRYSEKIRNNIGWLVFFS